MELAGNSRSTATGMFAVSNQVGAFGGASIGGAMLALAGVPAVGFFWPSAAILAAVVVRVKVRDSESRVAITNRNRSNGLSNGWCASTVKPPSSRSVLTFGRTKVR